MVHGLYSVYDKVGEIYSPVYQAVNDGVARRSFLKLVTDLESWDRDSFVLYRVGSFDDFEGSIAISENREIIEVDFPRFDEVKAKKLGVESLIPSRGGLNGKA